MKKFYVKCLNCQRYGHKYDKCEFPIKSFGVIAFKIIEKKLYFLLIQKKDSIGYVDFLRGKYDNSKIISLIEEMTNEERNNILTKDFDQLWEDLWIKKTNGSIFSREKERALRKFNDSNIKNIISNIAPSKYEETEYEFPKGRKKFKETAEECSIREFEEETGLKSCEYSLVKDIEPLCENFTGSDGIKYCHVYYLAQIKDDVNIKNLPKSDFLLEEVKNVVLLSFEEAYKKIRDYSTQKKFILSLVNKLISYKYALL